MMNSLEKFNIYVHAYRVPAFHGGAVNIYLCAYVCNALCMYVSV